MRPRFASRAHAGAVLGFRSGLEEAVSSQLSAASVPFEYEKYRIRYVVPARVATYRPDFVLPNGIVIETKGRFEAQDRQKHLLIQEQHPKLDIRFVFSRSATLIAPGSPTSYRLWCETHGFLFADKRIPLDWLTAEPNLDSLTALSASVVADKLELLLKHGIPK